MRRSCASVSHVQPEHRLSKYAVAMLIKIVTAAVIIVFIGMDLFVLIILIILLSCMFHDKDTETVNMLLHIVSVTSLMRLYNSFLSKLISPHP
jgi:uncharacterized protein involved in cysteine biosynthesis